MIGMTKILNSCPSIQINDDGTASIHGYGIMSSSAVRKLYEQNCKLTRLNNIELGGYACGPEQMVVFNDQTRWKILRVSFDEKCRELAEIEIRNIALLIQEELNKEQRGA